MISDPDFSTADREVVLPGSTLDLSLEGEHDRRKPDQLRVDKHGRLIPYRERGWSGPFRVSVGELLVLLALVSVNVGLVKLTAGPTSNAEPIAAGFMTILWFCATHRGIRGIKQQIKTPKGQLAWWTARLLPTLVLLIIWSVSLLTISGPDSADASWWWAR